MTFSNTLYWRKKVLCFYSNSSKDFSQGCHSQYGSIGSCNGLAPSRRQAINHDNRCHMAWLDHSVLIHWGRETHICVSKLNIIGSDNGLSPGRRQAIIWTNVGILSIGPLGTKLSEISIAIHMFSFKKMHLKVSSAKWRPFCLGLNVLS